MDYSPTDFIVKATLSQSCNIPFLFGQDQYQDAGKMDEIFLPQKTILQSASNRTSFSLSATCSRWVGNTLASESFRYSHNWNFYQLLV